MLWQLIPVQQKLALGSQKLFHFRFKPIKEAINYKALHRYIVDTTKSAYREDKHEPGKAETDPTSVYRR